MIIDYEKGKIAYHHLELREDGGIDFVQYDFGGNEVERYTWSQPPVQK